MFHPVNLSSVPQKRYLIATLFIAGMLMLVAVVQAFKPARQGGVAPDAAAVSLGFDSFETITDLRLEDGWAPKFIGTQDPDQWESWPPEGGFGTAWEPASPFMADQALALNGPGGRSEVALWRGLEWRHYRFEAPLASARLDPTKGNRLLVTLNLGRERFETRLMEIPEGRVLWATESGPWSRFSWDGKAVLMGLSDPIQPGRLLLTSLPVDGDVGDKSLAPWDEDEMPGPPRGWATRNEQLWDDGKDLPGQRLLIPWRVGDRLWMPRKDCLWTSSEGVWSLWRVRDGAWHREASGPGVLAAQPPRQMGLVALSPDGATRSWTGMNEADWILLQKDQPPWPAYDAAWLWRGNGALTAWDLRWGTDDPTLPKEHQREALIRAYRSEWRAASHLRASVRGWLATGPQVALREINGVAWVWVGDRVLLVRLAGTERLHLIKGAAG